MSLTLEQIKEQIIEKKKDLEVLRQMQVEAETKDVLGQFQEGHYYELHTGECTKVYFKFTKENVWIQDMTGTVGYTGQNAVVLDHCIEYIITRTSVTKGIVTHKLLSLDCFVGDRMNPNSVREITKEEIEEIVKDIIKYSQSLIEEK